MPNPLQGRVSANAFYPVGERKPDCPLPFENFGQGTIINQCIANDIYPAGAEKTLGTDQHGSGVGLTPG